jgi:acetyl-CoA synthetase
VLARRFAKFDAQAAFGLMQRHAVTHAFVLPIVLKMLRTVASGALALRVARGGKRRRVAWHGADRMGRARARGDR